MDKKGSQTALDVKVTPYGTKKRESLLNYKKETRIFDIKNHEREIKVRKMLTDFEDRQLRSKSITKEY